jgi:hypothetical protein
MNAPESLIIGAAIGGGFFAGRFFIGAQPWGLIVSPKVDGDLKAQPWGPVRKNVTGALSYNDGRANTLAMAEAGSKLAKQILELKIGEYSDWYLMSRQEALMAFCELDAAPAFEEGGAEAFDRNWYWTSTQHAANSDYAWYQDFGWGGQDDNRKDYNDRARAVRRLPL